MWRVESPRPNFPGKSVPIRDGSTVQIWICEWPVPAPEGLNRGGSTSPPNSPHSIYCALFVALFIIERRS